MRHRLATCVGLLGLVLVACAESDDSGAEETSRVSVASAPVSRTTTVEAGGAGRIAFSSNRAGSFDVWVMNADGADQTRLTSNSSDEHGPVWSPDGTRIAYTSGPAGGTDIWVMEADGSDQIQLTDEAGAAQAPVWSPDGTRIAYIAPGTGDFAYGNREGVWDVWVMDADGGNQIQLTNAPFDHGDQVWSPDGSRIAYTAGVLADDAFDIWVMDADGDNQIQLTTARSEWSPRWSPDGDRIAFTSNRNGNLDVWMMDADGTDQRPLTSSTLAESVPVWSPDGARIAFIAGSGLSRDIWVMDADGTNQVRLVVARSELSPVWSPDGAMIAFVSGTAGNSDIWVTDVDGANQARLTSDPGDESAPSWRPVIGAIRP